jgi:hypothetical protein
VWGVGNNTKLFRGAVVGIDDSDLVMLMRMKGRGEVYKCKTG